MRRGLAWVSTMAVSIIIACSSDPSPPVVAAPPPTAASPELSVSRFDVAEPGWGDAPVAVHFTWAIASTSGRPLTCVLDFDGDGKFEQRIEGCRANTLLEPVDTLPTFTYAKPGAHVPKLVVSDGVHTVEATQEIYANYLKYGPNTVFPEKAPGFVKAEAVPNTSVVLTYASEAQVPALKVGDILWGTSGTGYLIKATEVSKAGATVTVKGVQGLVKEAVETGFLGARDVTPSYDDVKCIDADCQGATFEKGAPPPAQAADIVTQTLGVRRDPLEASGQIGVKIKLPSGGLPVEHSVFAGYKLEKFILEFGYFSINRFVFNTVATFSYDIAIQAEAEKRFLLGTFVLGTLPIGPIVITPIAFPNFSIAAKLKVSANVGLDWVTNVEFTPLSGLRYNNGPRNRARSNDFLNSIGAAGEVEAKLSFPVSALIYGVIGPYLGPYFGVSAEVKPTPSSEKDPCLKGTDLCGEMKGLLGGEFGVGCPWIEGVDFKAEVPGAELKLADGCIGITRERDPEKCPDSGTSPPPDAGNAGDAGDAGETCTPIGTAMTPPTGGPSPRSFCPGAEVFWAGSGTGTRACWEIADILFPSTGNSGNIAMIPKNVPTGPQTLILRASGGTATADVMITDDLAPRIDTISPTSASAGMPVTLTGEGFNGISSVTVSTTVEPYTSRSGTVTSNTGTSLTFTMPTGITGPAKVDTYKQNCGLDYIAFTGLP